MTVRITHRMGNGVVGDLGTESLINNLELLEFEAVY